MNGENNNYINALKFKPYLKLVFNYTLITLELVNQYNFNKKSK